MHSQFEDAFRQVLKTAIREVMTELLHELPASEKPNRRKPDQPEEALLLRTREAAKLLSISDRHLYTLTRSGELPCVRVGKSVRYSVETLKAWIHQAEATSPSSLKERSPVLPSTQADRKSVASRNSSSRTKTEARTKAPSSSRPKRAKKPIRSDRKVTSDFKIEERVNPFSVLLKEIGVDRGSLPPITNGELMRIAGVDTPTMHGWMYLNRDLPNTAIDKLKRHFLEQRTVEEIQDS